MALSVSSDLPLLPVRLNAMEAAWYLGFQPHEIFILTGAGMLDRSAILPPTRPSFFLPNRWRSCGTIRSGSKRRRMPSALTGGARMDKNGLVEMAGPTRLRVRQACNERISQSTLIPCWNVSG